MPGLRLCRVDHRYRQRLEEEKSTVANDLLRTREFGDYAYIILYVYIIPSYFRPHGGFIVGPSGRNLLITVMPPDAIVENEYKQLRTRLFVGPTAI